jgi:predicted alpha/beta superfamily hydrolase
MKLITLLPALLLVHAAGSIVLAEVSVTVIVNPPASTPTDAKLYIAGNHESVGPWAPDKHALKRDDDGTWRTTLELPNGFALQYKITQGSWGTVEMSKDGIDISNRIATVKPGLELKIDVAAWAAGKSGGRRRFESSLTGNIKLIEKFRSEVLDNERNLIVYLPEAYDREPERRFPVLYMHDGQNIFDRATSAFGNEWGVDETAQELIRAKKVEPLIVVGVYTEANRTDELTDTASKKHGVGGKAPLYAKFLVEEVKPFIDETYRTKSDRANTGVGGSSLGGLVSLYLIEKHPEVFGRCAAVSPALMWSDGALTKRWGSDAEKIPLQRTKIWIDVGSEEGVQDMTSGAYLDSVRSLVEVFKKAGLEEGINYRFIVKEGAKHNEAAWRKRFPEILQFLFPAK